MPLHYGPTPLSFATYSDLSAAVAANGGQPVGAVVNVAGAVYAWTKLGYRNLDTSRPSTMAILGDSLSENMSAPYFAALYAGYTVVARAGIGGNTSKQMLDRFDTDVSVYNPTFVYIGAGTNDVALGVPFATTLANIVSIVKKSVAIGADYIIAIPPPRNGPYLAAQAAFNELLEITLRSRDLKYIKPFETLTDPLTGGYLAGVSDNTHPNKVGKELILSSFPALLPSPNTFAHPMMNVSANGLFDNPLMLLDTNSDGVPDGWTKAGPTTVSITDPEYIFGKAIKLSLSGQDGANPGYVQRTLNIISNVPTSYVITGKIKTVMDGSAMYDVFVEPYIDGVLTGSLRKSAFAAATCSIDTRFAYQFTFPAGLTKIRVVVDMLKAAGYSGLQTGDLEIGELQIYSLTNLGL